MGLSKQPGRGGSRTEVESESLSSLAMSLKLCETKTSEEITLSPLGCTIGIDPGAKGGLVILWEDDKLPPSVIPFRSKLPHINLLLRALRNYKYNIFIEELGPVMGFRGNGPKINWVLSGSYHYILGQLDTLEMPYTPVPPKVWQAEYDLVQSYKGLSKADRKRLKQDKKKRHRLTARALFPDVGLTHYTADAALIAEYGKRLLDKTSLSDLKSAKPKPRLELAKKRKKI